MIRITDGRYIRHVYGTPVVADIFRATSNIVTMLMRGASEIVPVDEVNRALLLKREGYILFGEENLNPIEGFDYGNSPVETSGLDLEGKKVVLKTTNGTGAIIRAGEGTLIGSFLNITSLSRYLRNREVHIFPANLRNGVSTEDNEFAYALTKKVLEPGSNIEVNITRARNGNGASLLRGKKLEADISFCLQQDITDIIPVYREGKIVKADLSF
ncbi:MAG: 2-phosphosulfolactate phosphatase [Candidatus Thermoplasmatota archaeon]|jgi:2-phosphosulfolactate phosphatase|nr:2-phosphosulfolactate phosphatase [Candidatus Thermoplasmatota archaeon]MCL5789128.1 2-phosphosulfolactate phosphatase [Candidatus Thermoplasmatota archaeon]